jgi:hypothetical protein
VKRALVFVPAVVLAACGELLGLSGDDETPVNAADAEVVLDASGGSDGTPEDASLPDTASVLACDGAPCERIVFVTSAVYSGKLGGLAGADAKCMQVAASTGGKLANRTFAALLSGDPETTGDAIDRLAPGSLPFRRVDGVRVAEANQLFNDAGTLSAPINLDETGVERTDLGVWTGTNAFGRVDGNHCSDWTSEDQGLIGTSGTPHAAGILDGTWLLNAPDNCNRQRRLYCIQR